MAVLSLIIGSGCSPRSDPAGPCADLDIGLTREMGTRGGLRTTDRVFDTDRLRSGFAFTSQKTGRSEDELEADALKAIPAKRFGHPDEFGELCAFICSAQASYITGQNFLIDGGAYPGTY